MTVTLQQIKKLPEKQRVAFFKSLKPEEMDALWHQWAFIGRPEQILPDGDWSFWLYLAGRGAGKALAVDTPILTKNRSWTTMGELVAGDVVFDEEGIPCNVLEAHPVLHDRRCYNVVFSDESSIVADAEHLWETATKNERYAGTTSVRTTEQIKDTLIYVNERNHAVAVAAPLQYETASLPIPPYVLGAWLGDGNSDSAYITSMDPEIIANIEAEGFECVEKPHRAQGRAKYYNIRYVGQVGMIPEKGQRFTSGGGFHSVLKSNNLLHNKHIPRAYLTASVEQRIALMQGLVDTDGTLSKGTGEYTISSSKKDLALDILELACGLGLKATIHSHMGQYRVDGVVKRTKPYYDIRFRAPFVLTKLTRKVERHVYTKQFMRSRLRYIEAVDEVPTVPIRCITVDSPSRLYLAGRTLIPTHNTRTGGETVREWVKRGKMRVGMIAPTAADTRDVMVEGESGILNSCWEKDETYDGQFMGKPLYEPSKRRLTWAHGAIASLYSADEAERLRGPQHDALWADELCAWRDPMTWDLAMFGLRLGKNPQAFISTTPKPTKLIKEVLRNPATIVTRGSTYDNRDNLADSFFKQIITKYEGTRLGKQELMGELLEESEDALWNRENLDDTRLRKMPENVWIKRLVVAVDPATTSKMTSAETGMIVVGLGSDDHIYVLHDASGRMTPEQWGAKAVRLWREWSCDSIIAEVNQGGDMVKHVFNTVDRNVPVRMVRAARGKQARAEPVSAMWEQKRAHIVGDMPELEDQMCQWEPLSGDESPDRIDALVWGVHEVALLGGVVGQGRIENAY
jgi:phage terminase large subunit-like protein